MDTIIALVTSVITTLIYWKVVEGKKKTKGNDAEDIQCLKYPQSIAYSTITMGFDVLKCLYEVSPNDFELTRTRIITRHPEDRHTNVLVGMQTEFDAKQYLKYFDQIEQAKEERQEQEAQRKNLELVQQMLDKAQDKIREQNKQAVEQNEKVVLELSKVNLVADIPDENLFVALTKIPFSDLLDRIQQEFEDLPKVEGIHRNKLCEGVRCGGCPLWHHRHGCWATHEGYSTDKTDITHYGAMQMLKKLLEMKGKKL